MACKRMLILDAVPVNHSGDDRLHSAHSHRPGLHHGSEVQYSSVLIFTEAFGYLIRRWRNVEVEFIEMKERRRLVIYVSGSQAVG